jgi:hypothetical protein
MEPAVQKEIAAASATAVQSQSGPVRKFIVGCKKGREKIWLPLELTAEV